MRADEAFLHPASGDLGGDGRLHRDHIRDATAGGVLIDGVEHRADDCHGGADHDERAAGLCAFERGLKICTGVESLLRGFFDRCGRAIPTEAFDIMSPQIAHHGATDEAQTEDAYRG